ncbi:ABC-2 transporter permease [Paenibacillus sp. 1P07SE]|uniref:ABC-2 transporter permease n=1 Tax=Paenibacillus sp. 1P07SE TaxID=3132209 RepID=UPI0039A66344
MSGWNKFVFTLPLTRNKLVQSHYVLLLLLVAAGVLLAMGLFYGAAWLIGPSATDVFYNFTLRGIEIVLCMATLSCPLTFAWGRRNPTRSPC